MVACREMENNYIFIKITRFNYQLPRTFSSGERNKKYDVRMQEWKFHRNRLLANVTLAYCDISYKMIEYWESLTKVYKSSGRPNQNKFLNVHTTKLFPWKSHMAHAGNPIFKRRPYSSSYLCALWRMFPSRTVASGHRVEKNLNAVEWGMVHEGHTRKYHASKKIE